MKVSSLFCLNSLKFQFLNSNEWRIFFFFESMKYCLALLKLITTIINHLKSSIVKFKYKIIFFFCHRSITRKYYYLFLDIILFFGSQNNRINICLKYRLRFLKLFTKSFASGPVQIFAKDWVPELVDFGKVPSFWPLN